jgi:hypothetical protein
LLRRGPSCPLADLVHEALAECTVGFVLIVRTAAQAQVSDGRPAAPRDRLDVIELEPGA